MTWSEEEQRRHLQSRPSEEGLRAMARALGRGVRVARLRRLRGGLGSATSGVDLINRSGRTQRVVLKRYLVGTGVGLEWERLTFAQNIEIPTPEPLALDEEGRWFGSPSLVISRLPGSPSLLPDDLDAWMHEIASALTAIQSYDPSGVGGALRRPHPTDTWTRPDTSAWGTLFERAATSVDEALRKRSDQSAVCHGDFHPGNMLFLRGRLSGVVDWSGTRVGPRSFDLSYCRTEIALLFGGDAPDRLRSAYEAVSGVTPRDLPLWDLMCALGARRWSHTWLTAYREQGRTDLTLRQFRSRLQAFTARALSAM